MNHPSLHSILPAILIAIFTIGVFGFLSQIHSLHGQTGYTQDNMTLISSESNSSVYTNEVLGISFNYPSGGDLKEKENRFDSGPDVTVSNGSAKFVVTKSEKDENDELKSLGLAGATRHLEEIIDKGGAGEIAIIEETDVDKYKIGGERTGTFLFKYEGQEPAIAIQSFTIAHKGEGYKLAFHDSTSTFDSPQTQSIMERIIQSFKFLQ